MIVLLGYSWSDNESREMQNRKQLQGTEIPQQ